MDLESIPYTLIGEECSSNGNYREFKFHEYSMNISTIMHTCLCDEHCSWEMCNFADPPKGCLENINSNWQWDDRKNTWVAQVVLGISFLCKNKMMCAKYVLYSNNTPTHEQVYS